MTAMTDEQILDLWSPRIGDGVQRPILGKNKIIAFGRACSATERARADALQAENTELKSELKTVYQHHADEEARADALEAALRRWLPATRPYLFDASEQDQWKADRALLEKPHD